VSIVFTGGLTRVSSKWLADSIAGGRLMNRLLLRADRFRLRRYFRKTLTKQRAALRMRGVAACAAAG